MEIRVLLTDKQLDTNMTVLTMQLRITHSFHKPLSVISESSEEPLHAKTGLKGTMGV